MRRALALGALLLLTTAAVADRHHDPVVRWNEVTLETIRRHAIPPPRATRLLALVHLAMHDAASGGDGRFESFAVRDRRPARVSRVVATSVAAHAVLTDQLPADAAVFDAALAAALRGHGARRRTASEAWGRHAATAVLAARAGDGADVQVPYVPGSGPGVWVPTPPGFLPALLPGWPRVRPFAMPSGDAMRAPGPPALDSAAYAAAFDEVRRLGGATGSERTPEQSEIALFWDDGRGTATPPGHWNVIAQGLAPVRRMTFVQRARLFALLNLALADAAVCAWDTKYAFHHWRPVTGIRAAADDGNPATAPDPAWESLITTPPFPAYVSGHSTFSATAATVLATLLRRDDLPFTVGSEGLPGTTRRFPGLWAAAEEAGRSRVYGGIHWQYDDQDALEAGRRLGRLCVETRLRPR